MSIENIRRIKEAAKVPKPKKYYRMPKKSAKKTKQEKEEKELLKGMRGIGSPVNGEFDEWFRDRMRENDPVCMNCGMRADWLLDPQYEKLWRACQAHILPKRKTQFPSVATHPLNHLVLFPVWGGHLCGCHDEYDSSWYNATTMKVWSIAVLKFKQFELSIAINERYRIPEQFLKDAPINPNH